jgi:cytochrome c
MRRPPWFSIAIALLMVPVSSCSSRQATSDSVRTPPSVERPTRFDFGRAATAEEIAVQNIDVMGDGTGLPPGRGSVADGEVVYAARCAVCHGRTGTEGPWDVLVGRQGADFRFGDNPSLGPKTIGNYWPYAPTVFDYIRRSMPQDRPGSLSNDEGRNEIIERTAVIDATTLAAIRMPARHRFVADSLTRRR